MRVSATMNRHPRSAAAPKPIRAVAVAAITVALIASCRGPVGAPGSSPTSTNEPPASAVPTAVPSAGGPVPTPANARPPWVADLEGQLDCDGPMNQIGEEVPADVGPGDPVPTPGGALGNLLRLGLYAWLPASGFEAPLVEGHWAQHRYLVDAKVKAIAISTNEYPEMPDPPGWDIVGLRACDASEFDPDDGLSDGTTIWLDATGDRVPTDRIFSRAGPGHCGWEGVTFLQIGDELYLRDPEGLLAGQTALPFKAVDALPAEAVDTDLHTATLRLFRVADPRVIYARYEDGTVERWGRALDQIGCM